MRLEGDIFGEISEGTFNLESGSGEVLGAGEINVPSGLSKVAACGGGARGDLVIGWNLGAKLIGKASPE